MYRFVSLAVLFVGASALVSRLGVSEARAESWLRENPDADQQGLNDLKNSDPDAYAIVSALLMKKQAGLLDLANPTGKNPEAEHESAADIMRDAPSIDNTEGSQMSQLAIKAPVQHAVYTRGNPWAFKANNDDSMVSSVLGDASTPSMPSAPSMPSSSLISSMTSTGTSSHGDPWAFKPHNDDEAMVSSVLGQVSQLTGTSIPSAPSAPSSSLISSRRSSEASPSALNADMDLVGMAGSASDLGAPRGNYYGISMDWGKKPAAPTASMSQQASYVAPAQPAPAAQNRANPYLEGIDFGNQPVPVAQQPVASMVAKGSYLSEINFPGSNRPAQAPMNKAANDLQGFSWGEYSGVASGAVKVRPVETQYMQVVEDKVDTSKLKGALSDWLAPDQPTPRRKPVAQQQEQEQPAEKVDPMAMDKYNNWAQNGNFQ